MTRVKVIWYWKRYMRKNRYHYKRYLLPLPKTIGDMLDTRVEYIVQLVGPAIVYVPKDLEGFVSRLEDLQKASRQNTAGQESSSTSSLVEE